MRAFACERVCQVLSPWSLCLTAPLLCYALAPDPMADSDNSHTADAKQPIVKSRRQDYKFTLRKT